MKKKILILGAEISRIYLGHKLKKARFFIKILEANNKIGGRIYTKKSQCAKVELGATRLWKYNEALVSFKNDQFLRPHANNRHQIYQQEFLNGKFRVAGSETSTS